MCRSFLDFGFLASSTLRGISTLRSARLSFQFNSRNFGLLSDCVSGAPKAPARAFAGHLILSCGVGVFSRGYTLFEVQRRQKAKAKAKAQAEGACLPCFSLSWNASPSFGSEKWVWFGVRGGWPPQYAKVATICAAAHSTNITCARPLNVLKFLGLRLSCFRGP